MAKPPVLDKKKNQGWQVAEDNTLRFHELVVSEKLEWLEDARKLAGLFKGHSKSSTVIHERP